MRMIDGKSLGRLGGVVLWLAAAAAGAAAVPVTLSEALDGGQSYMRVRLLGALRLSADAGLVPGALSGLAWDEDEGLLYAVADTGSLLHLRPVFRDERLVDAQLVAAYPLRGSRGQPLRQPFADAEGLAIANADNGAAGDSRLLVSFEIRPRLAWYTPAGRWLKDEPLPALLRDARRYNDVNSALESVVLHPRWGLLTAPELPLQGAAGRVVPIVSGDNEHWSYPLYTAPGSALVDMEVLPDESLLTLERAFVSVLRPLVISLRRVRLGLPTTRLAVEEVAVFDTSRGWLLDNFEGLARHRGWRFFMISDDNHSPLQSTLLVYFEVLEAPPALAR